MNGLNDGRVHGMDEVSQTGLEQAAKEFSEGSEDLEKILLNLWGMGIDTFACCKGSKDATHNIPGIKQTYVSVLITPENVDKVKTLMRHIRAQDKKRNNPNMCIIKDTFGLNNSERTSLLIDRVCFTNKCCKDVLKNILSATEDMKLGKELNENYDGLDNVFDIMDDFVNRKMNSSRIYTYISLKCPHLESTPTIKMKGNLKFNGKVTDKTIATIRKEWEYASYQPKSNQPKTENFQLEDIKKTDYYEQQQTNPYYNYSSQKSSLQPSSKKEVSEQNKGIQME